jgi:uncharacterized protein
MIDICLEANKMNAKHSSELTKAARYSRFGLTLMVTNACNMRCTYCYNGIGYDKTMSIDIGTKAIDRSIASLQNGGRLELGFFGGEPMLEPDLILALIEHAQTQMQEKGLELLLSVTTNGTITNNKAWQIMMMPNLDLAISIDGHPQTHDRNRIFPNGRGSSAEVLKTVSRLIDAGKDFKAVTVVRPDNERTLDDEILFLRSMGIRRIELSLDFWTKWDANARSYLEDTISRCAALWVDGLPEFGLSWFDDKAAMLTRDVQVSTCRCGFGKGDIAVTPSGRLYPCERLIGDDKESNSTRLDGNVFGSEDFLFGLAGDVRTAQSCLSCGIKDACNTSCGCCNYARTSHVGEPDNLLCMFNQWCLRETQSVLENRIIS